MGRHDRRSALWSLSRQRAGAARRGRCGARCHASRLRGPGLDQRPLDPDAGLLAVVMILGPVLMREGGYAFDAWTPENGRSCGYVYRRIEDAYYARKADVRSPGNGHAGDIL